MHFATLIPDWNSLDSVRRAHSVLEGIALIFFALLVVFDVIAHLSDNKEREKRLEKIGLCFFAIAVLAEISAYPYGQRNDTLSEQIIGSLDVKARNADINASNALTNAGVALGQANDALRKSGEAVTKATGAQKSVSAVKREARDLLMKYRATEGEVVELKSAKLPRRLSSLQKEIFRRAVSLFTIRGSPTNPAFNISCINPGGNQAQEMLDFELDFKDAIDGKTPVFFQFGLDCQTIVGGGSVPPIEVYVGADRAHDGRVLITALADIGIKDKDVTVKSSDSRAFLALAIGPKPE